MSAVVTQADELELCPFCGCGMYATPVYFEGTNQYWKLLPHYADKQNHAADCPFRNIEAPGYTLEAEAITAWNTRHRSEAVEELVAALDDGAILVRSLMLELGICDHIVRIDGRAVSTAAFLDKATAATLSKHRAPIAQGGS